MRNVVPQSLTVKLKYAEAISLNPGVAAFSNYIWRANDLYDPNYTGGGHQPRGFDQWMVFYNHFTVIGSKFTVILSNKGTAITDEMFCALKLSATTSTFSAQTDFMEDKFSRWAILDTTSPGRIRRLVATFSSKNFFARPNAALINTTPYRGNDAASPTEDVNYILSVSALDTANDPTGCDCRVFINYTAVFTEPRIYNAS